jgi:uncharacterized HAD superfamily protein/hypoxanthine phosphoribosyltransferase
MQSMKDQQTRATKGRMMRFRSIADLSALLVRDSDRFRSFDLIVGIPRSGLMAATLLSLLIHRPVIDLDGYLSARRAWGGRRLAVSGGRPRRVLVLDDSVNTGAAMAEARARLAGRDDAVTYACVFLVPGGERLVDMYCEMVPHPRVFEWNVFHHGYGRHFCFDMDGVLCADPSEADNDDGCAYLEFLAKARPLRIPAVEIGCIVTCRLDQYRRPTEDWLSRHGIRFRELVMMPCSTAAERKAFGHARFKAQVYAGRRDAMLFIESCDSQAREIHRLTGRPVLAVSAMMLHGLEPHREPAADRQRQETPDRAIVTKESRHANGPPAAVRQRFLILAREAGERAESLRKVLEALGKVEVVVDRPDQGRKDADTGCSGGGPDQDDPATVWIPDGEAEGYGGLMSESGPFPRITAWSRAMVHLARTLEGDEAVWFVEDDVAGDAGSFAEFVQRTASRNADLSAIDLRRKRDDMHWPWWRYADDFFEEPCRGFQPLCRLSARLVRAVLDFRVRHGEFTFHEVLFASVARREGMSWLSWNCDAGFRHFVSRFRYRPEIREVAGGICHPVKNPAVHAAICAAPPPEFARLAAAKGEDWSIEREAYEFLARYCRRHGIRRVAEFGPGNSTCSLLDAGCRVVSYEHDFEWLQRWLDRFEGEKNVELVHCPEGALPGPPPFAPELVFVDGPPFREGQEMSRLHACEWALEVCGSFLLHDANRDGEKATLAEMERRGMQVTRIPTRKGLALVADPSRRPVRVPGTPVEAASKYVGGGGSGWFPEDWLAWSVLFGTGDKPVRVLETGAGSGAGASLMLDLLFTHLESEAHCIDLYDGEAGAAARAAFESNAGAGGHGGRLHLYEGLSREVLAWMIAEEGYWESFDFIRLGGSASGPGLLADACQAWALLKPGGVMVFDGRTGGRAAAGEAFLGVYAGQLQKVLVGERMVVAKQAR